jgi:hypothetical protein
MNTDDSQLRNEIIESQKVRSDLLKWKLVLVSSMGAAGLGLINQNTLPKISYVLCCIPFVCLYVDLLCKHLNIRMIVISHYFRVKGKIEYEAFADGVRKLPKLPDISGAKKPTSQQKKKEKGVNAYGLEDIALHGSTAFLSISVMIYGFFILVKWIQSTKVLWWTFVFSGLFGLIFTWIIDNEYNKRCKRIQAYAEKLQKGDGDPTL